MKLGTPSGFNRRMLSDFVPPIGPKSLVSDARIVLTKLLFPAPLGPTINVRPGMKSISSSAC